jgi:hypothetical protein
VEARLVVLTGKAKGNEVPLASSQFVIGRGANCHLRPHSELVSKLDCVIGRNGGIGVAHSDGEVAGTPVEFTVDGLRTKVAFELPTRKLCVASW